MSLEAWGDDDGADAYDHLLEAGWWTSEQVGEVTEAAEKLQKTAVYQNGNKDEGISVEFLMRLNLLFHAINLDVPSELVKEALEYFGE